MSDRIRQLLTTALVALVAGSLAGVTSAALAQETDSSAERVFEVAANADTVDGFSAIGATANKALRARKLVATNRYGQLPSNIIRPRWRELKGVPLGFKDGVDDVGVAGVTITRVVGPSVTVPAGDLGDARADCPTGSKVVGGGFYSFEPADFNLAASKHVETGPQGWFVDGVNTSAAPLDIKAIAMCMSVEPGWALTVAKKGVEPASRRGR